MAEYGQGDTSYQAAGGEAGIRKLVDAFYQQMTTRTEAIEILAMHKADLNVIKDKLTVFLIGWMGGPSTYGEKYGSLSIPSFHAYLDVKEAERDAWLFCMREALKEQAYDEDFKQYLIYQLAVPAERIRVASQRARGAE